MADELDPKMVAALSSSVLLLSSRSSKDKRKFKINVELTKHGFKALEILFEACGIKYEVISGE